MSSARIHRLVAVCIAVAAFILYLTLWISGGDARNADYLIWTVFSMAGAGIAVAALAVDFKDSSLRVDWAIWALPVPYLLAGILSAFV